MGKRLILSEDEKLYIRDLYKGLINEQKLPGLTNTSTLCDVVCGKAAARGGTKGNVVKTLQEALISCGYELPQYGADGKFGNETRQATLKYQRDKNLNLVDGAIGPETSGQMIKDGCLEDPNCQCEDKKTADDEQKSLRAGYSEVIKRNLDTPCEDVNKCISEFMSLYEQDSCIDSDSIRELMSCLGLGECFKGGYVPIKEGKCQGCPEWYNTMPGPQQREIPEHIVECERKGCTKFAS